MLIPLLKTQSQPKVATPAASNQPVAPITANLEQVKSARKVKSPKSAPTSTKGKDKELEKAAAKREQMKNLIETINRIFQNEDAILITTQPELEEFLSLSDVFGLDTETTGLFFYKDKIVGFSLGTATKSAYIPLAHTRGQNYQDDLDKMCELLLTKEYYGFNAQFDWHFLEEFKPQLRNLRLRGEGSVALRCYNINLPHELKPAYKALVDPSYEDYSFNKLFKGIEYKDCDPADVYKYAAVDARKHYVLTECLENKLRTEVPEVYKRYQRIELRVLKPIYEAEKYGFCFDAERAQMLYDRLEAQKAPTLEKIQEIAGDSTFNPASVKQVKEAFEKIGIHLVKTDEETLAGINHPLAKAILEYRGLIKMQGTYTTNLLQYTRLEDGNHILHAGFNSIGAETGRMSSKNPNLQNLPRDNDYRQMLTARPGHMLISVDYSQQEVRILASLAKDQTMMDAFNSGKDFYQLMASIVFKLPYEACAKHGPNGARRNQMKSVVLGLNYSMGIQSLAADLGVSEAEAKEIVDAFYKVCPRVHDFQKWCLDFAKSHGYNETLFKHRRYYKGLGYKALGLPRFDVFGPGLKTLGITVDEIQETLRSLSSSRVQLRQFIAKLKEPGKDQAIYVTDRESVAFQEERQATNSVIQGTGAEMTKLAAIVAQDDPELKRLGAHIVNFIHDEILIEAPEENADAAGDRLAFIMNDVCADVLDGINNGGCEGDKFFAWTKDA